MKNYYRILGVEPTADLTTLLVFFAICAQFLFLEKAYSQKIEWKPMTPILDQSVDPTLHFEYCKGRVQKINRDILTRVGFSKQTAQKFKSSEVIQIEEAWYSSRRRVEISRSYLATSEDAVAFTCTEFFFISVPADYVKTSDIGDKTWYFGGSLIFFTKGNVLVKIELSILNEDKEYTKKIALSVEKKL